MTAWNWLHLAIIVAVTLIIVLTVMKWTRDRRRREASRSRRAYRDSLERVTPETDLSGLTVPEYRKLPVEKVGEVVVPGAPEPKDLS